MGSGIKRPPVVTAVDSLFEVDGTQLDTKYTLNMLNGARVVDDPINNTTDIYFSDVGPNQTPFRLTSDQVAGTPVKLDDNGDLEGIGEQPPHSTGAFKRNMPLIYQEDSTDVGFYQDQSGPENTKFATTNDEQTLGFYCYSLAPVQASNKYTVLAINADGTGSSHGNQLEITEETGENDRYVASRCWYDETTVSLCFCGDDGGNYNYTEYVFRIDPVTLIVSRLQTITVADRPSYAEAGAVMFTDTTYGLRRLSKKTGGWQCYFQIITYDGTTVSDHGAEILDTVENSNASPMLDARLIQSLTPLDSTRCYHAYKFTTGGCMWAHVVFLNPDTTSLSYGTWKEITSACSSTFEQWHYVLNHPSDPDRLYYVGYVFDRWTIKPVEIGPDGTTITERADFTVTPTREHGNVAIIDSEHLIVTRPRVTSSQVQTQVLKMNTSLEHPVLEQEFLDIHTISGTDMDYVGQFETHAFYLGYPGLIHVVAQVANVPVPMVNIDLVKLTVSHRYTPPTIEDEWLGITQHDGLASDFVQVAIDGSVSKVHSSLFVGQTYYIQTDGSLTTNPTSNPIGIALSDTEIYLTSQL